MTAFTDDYKGQRLQYTFGVEDGEVKLNVPKMFDRDLDFTFAPPAGYRPSVQLEDLSLEEWQIRLDVARECVHIRSELVDKILTSLASLPDLETDQQVASCYSGGKDSAAIMVLARMRYPKDRIFAMFADTQDEWPETYQHIPEFIRWIGVRDFRQLESMGIHTLLEEKIPCWPIAKRRHCTKNLKLLPMRDHLDTAGYDQVLKVKRGARFRPTHELQGADVDVRYPAPLLLSGERRMEGLARSDIQLEPERDETLMRITARPVLEWSIQDVWEFLFWVRAPYNPVYHWIKRVACAGCPFAGDDEMYTLGEHHPDRLRAWARTENIIGVPRLGGVAFNKVLEDLEDSGMIGRKAVG
ncbi:phosphoadenosine phosphosulfate reductase family protein [Paenibacillus daejeonensis]|uniref:phosphoadenosine phosphosulfate reductase family protein n=1 Tax=Paenibacillus daejeonensis TaxID=135193 RepID=UPI00036E3A30|nr:phosphoadenosine phosphosulfate reductase family protein [Paenibacillus daejeonensis]